MELDYQLHQKSASLKLQRHMKILKRLVTHDTLAVHLEPCTN
jgi:hypothetical protein